QYGMLQQDVDMTKALYRNFLEKSDDANFELAQRQNNLRVIEPARAPRITTGPNRNLWVMAGFVLSLMFGVGVAVTLEFFDRGIRSLDDLSKRLQLPALAVIPTIGTKWSFSLLDRFKRKPKLVAGYGARHTPLYGGPNKDSEASGASHGKTQVIP